MRKTTKRVQKLCLEVRFLSFLSHLFIHFAPFRSVVQNPFCHFLMDEPQGPYSPVHGVPSVFLSKSTRFLTRSNFSSPLSHEMRVKTPWINAECQSIQIKLRYWSQWQFPILFNKDPFRFNFDLTLIFVD